MGIKFSDTKSREKSRVMLIDSMNLAFRYKHAKVQGFFEDYKRTVESLANSYHCGTVIICVDEGSSSFRRSLYPEYKQNRKDKYETQTEAEKEEFEAFFREFREVIEQLREYYPVFSFKGVEADDIAAYIVRVKDKYPIKHIQLVSSDKDWDLLIRENVSRFSYVTRKDITWDNWFDHYDVTPEQYMSLKALQGDSGDNIKGVPQIGPKRAAELLEKYDDVFGIIDAIPINSNLKFIQNLNNSKDLLELNIQLVDLITYCEEALGPENTEKISKGLEDVFS